MSKLKKIYSNVKKWLNKDDDGDGGAFAPVTSVVKLMTIPLLKPTV